MVASAIFIMDTKGKVIVARNYRGDIPMSVADRYTQYNQYFVVNRLEIVNR